MPKIIIISLFIFIVTLSVKSQSLTIIVDQLSTAQLIRLPDSNRITKNVTNQVTFSVTPNTSYYLIVSSAGFKTHTEEVNIKDSAIVLTIHLISKSNLQNVTVIARKPLITQEEDKTIVDAEPLTQSSTNAYEVLEKIPGAVVDQDGNVYLNSANPATIQINGREVKLSAADLASLLKSLPANSVFKIEILRNPSAKYDAASSGGILNIVLKKGIKLGTNGSANIGYFQGKYATATGGFNLNKSSSKFQSYISYQYTNRKNFEQLNSNRFIQRDTSLVEQNAYTTYPASNHYLGAGTEFQVNKKLSFGYDLRISANKNNSDAIILLTLLKKYLELF